MSGSHEVVLTTGNARAMLDREVGEVMHPVVGPLVEAPQLYIEPSRIAERLSSDVEAPLVLFDVGLGAGSNAIAAWRVSEAREAPGRRLHIVSFDRTTAGLALAVEPDNAAAFDLEGEAGDAARALLGTGRHETDATTWTLALGELPDTLAGGPWGPADVVYWDAYSPRANPRLWTVAAFEALRVACAPQAHVHTYSAATATRSALLLAGFCVGTGGASASKSQTTIAAMRREDLSDPLGERWLERLGRSSAPWPTDAPPDAMSRVRAHRQVSGCQLAD